ncbi:MAG: Tex family protein, partial [Pseudoflavonifractor sp.]
PEDALAGASDIIAETISDDAALRKSLRALAWSRGQLRCIAAAKTPEDSVYRLYYDFKTPINRAQGHQILAINRGEKEEILKVNVDLDREDALIALRRAVLVPGTPAMDFIRSVCDDAYDRLIAPSLEREIRSMLTETASEGAIHMFGLNLKPLLLQPPVKGKVTMGLDPGYRNGCKVAVVDGTGKVLDTAVVYPTFSENKKQEAISVLSQLVKKHGVEHIAIGNGTASRETEQMAVELIRATGGNASYMIVNEAGASVYSASKLAAEEFPDLDLNLRSAASIARRLQDPLAELVKIDPQSIGVGQYQHDMPQARLDETLGGVVEDCVNSVGADLNTASAPLLTRVSGLNGTTAKNIVKYREENGIFTTRKQLLKVPKLGPKAFEQCAGFLRVPESKSVLDNTGVHPESYAAAEALLTLCGYSLKDVKEGKIADLKEKLKACGEEQAAAQCGVGVPTLRDIANELLKPGRDPRDELPKPLLRTDVMDAKDLLPGMELTGTVRNVIDFGVFVDIGVHQDGLVHISQLCDRRVRHPSELCAVGDIVQVWVLEVDEKKKRISLTMKKPKENI